MTIFGFSVAFYYKKCVVHIFLFLSFCKSGNN